MIKKQKKIDVDLPPGTVLKDSPSSRKDLMREAFKVLKSGGLIVYPTDTLYALGCDPFSHAAIDKLYLAKQRPETMPISVAAHDINAASKLAVITPLAFMISKRFLPGPITMLLDPQPGIADTIRRLNRDSKYIGIRIPKDKLAFDLIKRFGYITSTSANVHQGTTPYDIHIAVDELGGQIDLFLDTGPCERSGASTVVNLSKNEIKIVREGVLPGEQLIAAYDSWMDEIEKKRGQ